MRKSSVHGHRSAARYTTVIIIIIIIINIIIIIVIADDGIVNSLCKMNCSGTVIFGRKRGEIMIIIVIIACTLCVCVCVPSRAKTVQKTHHDRVRFGTVKENYTIYIIGILWKNKTIVRTKNRKTRFGVAGLFLPGDRSHMTGGFLCTWKSGESPHHNNLPGRDGDDA